MAHALTLTDGTFEKEVLKAQTPVLVDFWASWCGPCKAVAPLIEALAKEYKGKLKVGKIDVEDAVQTAKRYKIQSIPTLLLFKDGKVTKQIVGAASRTEIESAVKKELAAATLKQ